MILFAVKLQNMVIPFDRYLFHTGLEKVSLLGSECVCLRNFVQKTTCTARW
jgi:hypothetical protein